MTEKPYLFEADSQQDAGYRRRREDALKEAEIFLTRVGVASEGEAVTTPPENFRETPDWELVLQYVTEIQLNIRWYEDNLDRQTRWDRAWRTIAILIGAVILTALPIGIVVLDDSLNDYLAAGSLNLIITQVGVLLTGFMAYLKVLAAALDESDRQLAFWEASADLKEQLYTFERQWRERVLYTEASLTTEFRDGLLEQIAAARQIVRAERRAFFESQKSPLGLLEALSGSSDAVLARGAEVALARGEITTQEDPFTELLRARREAREAYDAARREIDALEYRVQVLKAAEGLPEREVLLNAALLALVDARVELQRAHLALEALSGAPR